MFVCVKLRRIAGWVEAWLDGRSAPKGQGGEDEGGADDHPLVHCWSYTGANKFVCIPIFLK